MTIEADYSTLLRQASATADDYLMNAIQDIDKRLGDGYAETHPDLIAAYMKVAAMDLGAASLAKEIGESISEAGLEIGQAISGLSESLRSDHPLQGQTFDGLESSLREIANQTGALAAANERQATWLKYLGNGDAASTMGAIEHLAVHLGEKIETAGTYIAEALEKSS